MKRIESMIGEITGGKVLLSQRSEITPTISSYQIVINTADSTCLEDFKKVAAFFEPKVSIGIDMATGPDKHVVIPAVRHAKVKDIHPQQPSSLDILTDDDEDSPVALPVTAQGPRGTPVGARPASTGPLKVKAVVGDGAAVATGEQPMSRPAPQTEGLDIL